MLERIRRFDSKSERNKRIIYYTIYTIIFLVMVLIAYLQFALNGKSFIWNSDGLAQHFPVLTYYSKLLRQTINSIFMGNGLQFPLWDFSIGAGADIITTLNYYGVGDPLCILAALFSVDKMEWGYSLLVLLRMYLAGVTFSAYCKEMGRGRFATLAGTWAYIFCGFVVAAGVRHPFFINPMIILPLLLLGIEKVFKKKTPYVLILAVFYAAITGVYFFYMLGILAGIYVLIRGWTYCGANKIKDFMVNLGKLIGCVGVGILLSGIIFIPNIISLLNSTRMQTKAIVEMFYDSKYYLEAPIKFLSGTALGSWTHFGYVALIAVSVFMMFSYRRKYTQLKIGFIILTIMLCLPYAGHVMNGFAYVSNRWVWGYSFLLAFIMVTMFPKIVNIDAKRFKALLVVATIYLLYLGWFLFSGTSSTDTRKLALLAIGQYLVLLVIMVLIFILRSSAKKKEVKDGAKTYTTLAKFALLATVIVNILLLSLAFYAPQGRDYVAEFCSIGTAYNRQTKVANVVGAIEDGDEFYRYSENAYDKGQLDNSALIAGMHSNSLYYSLIDENYVDYMTEMSCNDFEDAGRVNGLDSRTGLNALSATKYFITDTNKSSYVPHGYEIISENDNLSTYKNEHYLSLGYTYKNYISRTEYESLNAVQKEQALLQGIVLDDRSNALSEISPKVTANSLDYKVQCEDGVIFEENKFVVTKKKAKAVISFKGLLDSETYLDISKMQYLAPEGQEKNIDRAIINVSDEVAKGKDNEGVKKKIDIRTPYFEWYIGKHDFAVNMGYAKEAKSELTLTFSEKGEYTFDEMHIICQPMEDYATQVEKLREEVLENVVIGTNKVNGTIDLKDTKFLCMSIPYSKGWSIYVDGQKRELLRANTAYMGVELEAGHHQIELRYFTPYLKMSIACTLVGMLLFIGVIVFYKLKHKKLSYRSETTSVSF